eukprot:snap_masked-scaffold_5-processed-gene-19.34-mRNA-1 protein AED:1.00 eAED:1.00 QI:0/0/0/0/1/1/2/0/364
MVHLKKDQDCELPFLSTSNSTLCDISLFEHYQPLTNKISALVVGIHGFMVLISAFVFVAYTVSNKRHLKFLKVGVVQNSAARERKLTRKNLFILGSLCLGSIALFFWSINGWFLDNDFHSVEGKVNSLLFFFALILINAGSLAFLQLVKGMLGIFGFTKKKDQILKLFLVLGYGLNCVPILPIVVAVLHETLDLSLFIQLTFVLQVLTTWILLYLQTSILAAVIKALVELTIQCNEIGASSEKTNKLYTLSQKLKYYQLLTAQVVALVNFLGPLFVISKLNRLHVTLLIHPVLVGVSCLSLLPLYAVYSRFVIPGSDQCCSYKAKRQQQEVDLMETSNMSFSPIVTQSFNRDIVKGYVQKHCGI